MPKDHVEIAVVGAGAAGIAAARRLHDAGIDCLLIEARERLGGRAWTVQDPQGHALDLGCGWLHSADRNPWCTIARTQGLTIDPTPPPWARPALPDAFPLPLQHEFFGTQQAFYERLEHVKDMEDRPAADLLEPGNRWNALIVAIHTFVSGAELECVSAHDLLRYDDSGVNWRLVQGYGTAVAAHGAGVPLVLGCPVQRIDHGGRRLRIETAHGTIEAERAVIAVPTPMLAREDFFAPPLADKVAAAQALPLGLDDKLFLSLEQAQEFEADTRLFGRIDRPATAAYHLRPFGRPQIEAYFGGSLAADLERGGERAFFAFATDELCGVFGSAFARRLKPIRIHLWGADPFARGSYSYARPGKADCRDALAAPVDERLYFAGEACSRHDFSTAHGAWLTGVAAADRIIALKRGLQP